MMEVHERAYVAALLDVMGSLRVRITAEGTMLPEITVSTKNKEIHKYLRSLTGATAFMTKRTYDRHSCSEHCAEAHQKVTSKSLRWQVTGVRATMILHDCIDYMHIQRDQAEELLNLGINAPHKYATVSKTASLGWSIPEVWRKTLEVTTQ